MRSGASHGDFGIGFSLPAWLKHLQVKSIKSDRWFLRGLGEDADALALVRAIVMLGHGSAATKPKASALPAHGRRGHYGVGSASKSSSNDIKEH